MGFPAHRCLQGVKAGQCKSSRILVVNGIISFIGVFIQYFQALMPALSSLCTLIRALVAASGGA